MLSNLFGLLELQAMGMGVSPLPFPYERRMEMEITLNTSSLFIGEMVQRLRQSMLIVPPSLTPMQVQGTT